MAQRRKARPNGAGSAYRVTLKNGSRVWRVAETVEYLGDGKLIRVVGQGFTEKEARDRLFDNKVKRQIKLGLLPPEARTLTAKQQALTLDAYWQQWIAERRLAPTTQNEYRTRYRLHLAPHLGSKPLRLITVQDVHELIYKVLPAKKKRNGEPLLRETAVRAVYMLLYSVLDDASDLQHMNHNPCRAVPTPQRLKPDRQKRKQMAQLKAWVPMQLVKHLEGHEDEARWLLALFALRQSEVLGLCSDQVQWRGRKSRAQLSIERQLARHVRQHGCGVDPATGKHLCGRQSDYCPQGHGLSGLYLTDRMKTESSDRTIPIVEPLYSAMKRQEARL